VHTCIKLGNLDAALAQCTEGEKFSEHNASIKRAKSKVLLAQGKQEQAISELTSLIDFQRAKSIECAETLCSIAEIHKANRNFDQALSLLKEAHAIRQENRGAIAQINFEISAVYSEMSQFKIAHEFCELSLESAKNEFGPESKQIKRIEEALKIFKQLTQLQEVIQVQSEAKHVDKLAEQDEHSNESSE
jgi:tetratricopeptide (TPR) repeat protein